MARDAGPVLAREPSWVGAVRVESLRDQRANELVAILGRSALRDLVDLYFLDKAGWPADEGLPDALRKDAGTDPGWLAWAIAQVEIHELPGMITDLDLGDLARYRDDLVTRLLDAAGG